MSSEIRIGLRIASDPVWVARAVADLDGVLIDHAHCEKKAAASARALISRYPKHPELVAAMTALARQEAEHFDAVLAHLTERGVTLSRDCGDPYVQSLRGLVRPHDPDRLLDLLLVAGLIEERSCERFGLLADALGDGTLRDFYRELAVCEAGHARLFVELSRRYFPEADVVVRLDTLLDGEAQVVRALTALPTMHG